MTTEDTPDQACSIGGCPSITEFCSHSLSCPSATEHGNGVIIVGKIAAGLAQQVRRADGRILSETIAPNETAVLIPSSLLSELPEVVRLRDENEKLRGALKETADDIESWGAYASDYFKEKWDLKGCIAGYRALLSEGKSSSPQAEEKA